MKKKLASLLLAAVLIASAFAPSLTLHVHAEYLYCEGCGEWKGDDVNWCSNCYLCEDCVTDWCEDCACCFLCAYELGYHCPECQENCVDPQFGNYPHCESCLKCEDCAGTLTETAQGLRCPDCLEELQENEFITLCPNCGINVIGSEYDDDPMDENLGDCGEHCRDCYEEFLCPECDECTLCSGADLCGYCGICSDCAVDGGYHCPECGDCYAEAGQCPDGGDHCLNCCEEVCDDCGTCTAGAGIEYCDECGLCENCRRHCPECGECYESVGQCEDDGEHCRECCSSEGWICDQCWRCTGALGLSLCEFCGLCEECCRENGEYYGTGRCILDKDTKPEVLDSSKHDAGHHILRYKSSSEECHDVWCIFPGCGYYLSDVTPHEFVWKTVEEPTVGKSGKRTGYCIRCGEEKAETLPPVEAPAYYFVEQPKDVSVLPNKNQVRFYVSLGEYGSDVPPSWGFYTRLSALPVTDGETLPDTPDGLKNRVYAVDIRNPSYKQLGMDYAPGSGVFPCVIYANSSASEGKFAGYSAKGKTLVWRLALYDVRGGIVTYSDPFTVDWNAKHLKHSVEWVSGQISDREKNLYIEKDYSAQALRFYDGTFHWEECSVCGERISTPKRHRYSLKGREGDCKSGVEHYECKDCGHRLDLEFGSGVLGHSFADDLKFDEKGHWRYCAVCGAAGPGGEHDLKEKTYVDCEKTVVITVCENCGYAHLERSQGSGHKYTADGEFNGWYGDKKHHWKICTVCGYVNRGEHEYKGGSCSVCGIDFPQFAIVGAACTHGTELRIELMDDLIPSDKALFEAGQWNAVWYDEDSGNAVGLGKTYPLDAGDEGHSFRAEISLVGGDTYYAFMDGFSVTTAYLDVKGYPATCASEGLLDHRVCLGCGGKFIGGQQVGEVVIPRLATHTYDNSCDAVCNVCGFKRDASHTWSDKYVYSSDGHRRQCTVCGAVSPVDPHGLETEWINEGDCETDGLLRRKCLCGYSEEETVMATGHKWVHADAVPATCVDEGVSEHYYCGVCYALSADAQGAQKVGIKKLMLPVDPGNHAGGDKLGFNETEHYVLCRCGARIENAPHSFDGEGRCTVCLYKKGSGVKTGIAELTKHDMVFPNCVTTGIKEHYTDEAGKIYLSSAGVKPVHAEDLILPVSPVRHAGGDYAHTDGEHWIACVCGAELGREAHSFDGGVCTVCSFELKAGADQTGEVTGNEDTAPGGETSGEEETTGDAKSGDGSRFPWWILILVCVLLIAGAVILIIVKTDGRKSDRDGG